MNRKLLIGVTLLGGLTACTPVQRHLAQRLAAVVAPATVTPAGPSVTAQADCTGFSFTLSGYEPGTQVYLGLGSQPPGNGGTIDDNGGASGHWTLRPGEYETTHSFEAIVDVGNLRVFDQFVDCTVN